MNLVLFTHPAFLGLQSQLRLVRMLVDAFKARGHQVEVREPRASVRGWVAPGRWTKWAGYVDQFVLFPREMRRRIREDPPDTMYVFCDQALGPWIPVVAHRPHVVHCLDLLALRSALGLIPENPTSFTGRIYQRYIRTGFQHARHFISISEKSRSDLHEFGGVRPQTSDVVYLGLNYSYRAMPCEESRRVLLKEGIVAPQGGLLLHVGGGQWYKNASGVVALYSAYVSRRVAAGRAVLPLWLVSPRPSTSLRRLLASVPHQGEVRFLQGVGNDALGALYSIAGALIFPSLAEGFGWPIVEAMACGCPVVTTGEAPMSEVGGPHAHYLPRIAPGQDLSEWAANGARTLCSLLDRPMAERDRAMRAGVEWTRRFDTNHAIENYLAIYAKVLAAEQSGVERFERPSHGR